MELLIATTREDPKKGIFEMFKKTLVILAILSMCLIYGCKKLVEIKDKYPADNHIEELVEHLVEKKMENVMGLPSGALHGTVDFSFWEPEDSQINDCFKKCLKNEESD